MVASGEMGNVADLFAIGVVTGVLSFAERHTLIFIVNDDPTFGRLVRHTGETAANAVTVFFISRKSFHAHECSKSPHAAQPNESMVAVMTRNGCACGIQCGFPMRQLQDLCDYGRDKPVPPEWDES